MKENEIGALWINKGKKGEFLSGKITIDGEVTAIIAFRNDYKKAANHPDYRIFLSTKQGGEQEDKIPQKTDSLEPF